MGPRFREADDTTKSPLRQMTEGAFMNLLSRCLEVIC